MQHGFKILLFNNIKYKNLFLQKKKINTLVYFGNTLQIKKPQNSHLIPFKFEGISKTRSVIHSSIASDMMEIFAKCIINTYSKKEIKSCKK